MTQVEKDDNLTFENGIQELEQIVQQLEKGSLPLQEALTAFKRGVELSQFCQAELTQAEETVTLMMTQSGLKELDGDQA